MRPLTILCAATLLCLAACSSGGSSDSAPMADCCKKTAELKAQMPKCCAAETSECCKTSKADPSKAAECCKKADQLSKAMPDCCKKNAAGTAQDCCKTK
jgi:hypothetical protein